MSGKSKLLSVFVIVFSLLGASLASAPAQDIAGIQSRSYENSTWVGNGPYGGSVFDLAVGSAPEILYAASGGGVYKSVDGGDHWSKTSHPEVKSYAIAAAPSDGSVVYSGTADGIYKSENSGGSWNLKDIGTYAVVALQVDPRNAGVVYAASSEGVFKSVDGGDKWEHVLKLSGLDSAKALLIDTNNPDHVYAGLSWADDGLMRSINAGESWDPVHVSPDDWNSEDVYALAMTPAGYSPATLYAFSFSLYEDVYKSTNGGLNWSPTNTPEWWLASWPIALGVDPGSPNMVYVGVDDYYGQLLRSDNSGGSWTPIQNGLPEGNPTAFAIHPSNHSTLISLEEGGIYRSSDQGASWQMASTGLRNTTVNHVAIHPQNSQTAIAALHGSGHYLARTSNGGASWEYLTSSPPNVYNDETPAEIGAVAYDPGNLMKLYAGDGYNYVDELFVYKSSNGGASWDEHKFVSYSNFSEYNGVSDIWVSPDGYNVLVAVEGWGGSDGGGGIYRSTSSLTSWDRKFGLWTNDLVADPNAGNTIYAGTERCGYVYRSINGGQTWVNISPDPGSADCWVWQVRQLAMDTGSNLYAATSSGLWKWDGSNWEDFPNLPQTDLTGVALDGGHIYVSTAEDGIYRSDDSGASWEPDNDGLAARSMTELYLGTGGDTILYAGSDFGGVWTKQLEGIIYSDQLYIPFIGLKLNN